ncbi:MAG: hypothetical protein AAB896_03460 [Patescibacteria group bacterium]
MKNDIQNLYEFIDGAVRSRKYPVNTGHSLRAALKIFELELNEEERASAEKFQENIEQIYLNVFNKNKNRFSAISLATYKSRIIKLLNDYDQYGRDPNKMVNWTPKIIQRSLRGKTASIQKNLAYTVDSSGLNSSDGSLAPARTLPSGIVVVFPKSMDAQVSFGGFGEELKKLDEKGLKFAGESVGGTPENSN